VFPIFDDLYRIFALNFLKKIIYILGLCFVSSAFAKNKDVTDSLVNSLSHVKTDTQRVNTLNSIARSLNDYPDSSYKYASLAYELADKINFLKGKATSLSCFGEIYNAKGNYDLALKNLREAYTLYEKGGDRTAMNSVMNSIGNTYVGNKEYAKALEAFRTCYRLGKELNNKRTIAIASFGIGNIFGNTNKMDSAFKYLHIALEMFTEQKFTYAQAMTYAQIGQLKDAQKEYATSLANLEKAMDLFKQINQAYGIGVTYQAIGKTYYDMGEKEKALDNYLKAYDIHLQRNAFDNLKESCESVYRVYKDLGDMKNALLYHEKFMNYKDSVFNEKSRKQLLELETQYETRVKEKEIKLKNLALEKSQEEVRNRTAFLYVFIGVSLLFLLMGIFVFRQYREKRKANNEIMLQKNIIEEKNKSITDSIRYAQYIQQSILPDHGTIRRLIPESFVLYRPKDIVSGDFYWIASAGNYIYIAVVDCTGHGVPGAFMSMVGHNVLSNAIKQLSSPSTSELLAFLQSEVTDLFSQNSQNYNMRDGMDLSLVRLDLKNGKMQFSGANNPVCHIHNNILTEYKGNKVAISAQNENKDFIFSLQETDIAHSDMVYLFSDGYADQFGGPKGKKFKYKPLQQLLLSVHTRSMPEQYKVLNETLDEWRGNLEQVDDVLILGFRV
jgi:serine phosphatase RsbU (regulator of sigma subunit)